MSKDEALIALMAAAPEKIPPWFRADIPDSPKFKWVNSPQTEQFLQKHSKFFKEEVGTEPEDLFDAIEAIQRHFERQAKESTAFGVADMSVVFEMKARVEQVNALLGMLHALLAMERVMPENQPTIQHQARKDIAVQAQWATLWAEEAYANMQHVRKKLRDTGISAFTRPDDDVD